MTSVFDAFLRGRAHDMLTIAPEIATPRLFSDAKHEHIATRRAAGLFDFSFMGCLEIKGPGSLAFLHAVQTRTLHALATNRIAYTLLLRDDGTVLNDATVWRHADDRYWLFVGRRNDLVHFAASGNAFDVTLTDISQRHAVIAPQGPASAAIIARCFDGQDVTLPYYGFRRLEFADCECWLARIGYSGESGYELVVRADLAPSLWQALVHAGRTHGLTECGFEAIDTLRIEAGHILFTRELASPVTPAELGLTRLVDFYANDFCGASARRQHSPLTRRLVGLLPMKEASTTLTLPDQLKAGCGALTSAAWSPVFERTLGIGFVHPEDAYPGTAVRLMDGRRARVARLPFYDPGKVLPRRG